MSRWKASRNRFFAMVTGSKRIDRVPYVPLVGEQMITRISGMNVRTLLSSPKTYAKAAIMANDFLQSDIAALPTCYSGPAEGVAFAEVNDKKDAIKWFDYRPVSIEQGRICQTEEDVERLRIPDHSKSKIWNTTHEAAKIIQKETGFPQMVGLAIWSVVQQLRGIQAYRDMRTNPEILMTLCEKIYQAQIDSYNTWVEKVGPCPLVFFAGYAFNKQMMSFEDAMKYEGQFIKRMQKEIGGIYVLHNCSMEPYWEEVCKKIDIMGVNGSHPLDINFWVEFKKKFPKITIVGANIDVNREILTGTPEDVEAKVRENIVNLAPGGRYVVSPICTLPWNVPLPNVFAIPKAIEKYGTYPLQ